MKGLAAICAALCCLGGCVVHDHHGHRGSRGAKVIVPAPAVVVPVPVVVGTTPAKHCPPGQAKKGKC